MSGASRDLDIGENPVEVYLEALLRARRLSSGLWADFEHRDEPAAIIGYTCQALHALSGFATLRGIACGRAREAITALARIKFENPLYEIWMKAHTLALWPDLTDLDLHRQRAIAAAPRHPGEYEGRINAATFETLLVTETALRLGIWEQLDSEQVAHLTGRIQRLLKEGPTQIADPSQAAWVLSLASDLGIPVEASWMSDLASSISRQIGDNGLLRTRTTWSKPTKTPVLRCEHFGTGHVLLACARIRRIREHKGLADVAARLRGAVLSDFRPASAWTVVTQERGRVDADPYIASLCMRATGNIGPPPLYVSDLSDHPLSPAIRELSVAGKIGGEALPWMGPNESPELVILTHGIRTRAVWMESVCQIIERELGVETATMKYGFLDLVRFLGPKALLLRVIRRFEQEIADLAERYPNAEITICAHSFGTYIIGQILKDDPRLNIKQLILCGSVLPTSFDWRRIRSQIKLNIVNFCSRRDLWPCWAEIMLPRYGSSGSWGFDSDHVVDRFFSIPHSEYLTKSFVQTHWIPALRGETLDESDERSPSLFQKALQNPGAVRLMLLALVVTLIVVAVITAPSPLP